jgi:hypothetical protein
VPLEDASSSGPAHVRARIPLHSDSRAKMDCNEFASILDNGDRYAD